MGKRARHTATGIRRLTICTALALAGCGPVSDVLGGGARTPHEEYAESLRDAGLAGRALGAAWLAAADRALAEPLPVTLPFRETGFFPGEEAGARGYRIAAQRGQRLVIEVETEADGPARLFVDLFEADEGDQPPWDHVESVDSVTTAIRHTIDRDGVLALRIQPELLQSIRYTVTIQVEPTLAFPVDGHGTDDIRSAFGVDRDGGRRVHHGVDIFAPRGTPVIAAAEGRAEAGTNRLGGNVVWQRVAGLGALYYAHLDSQAFDGDRVVRPGDTVGFVGNTGNAVTTPPHLHFGIYARPGGPVDPFPYLYEPEEAPLAPLASDVQLGALVRTTARRTVVREGPDPAAAGVDTLPSGTVARMTGGAGDWRRIDMPDRRTGFVRVADVSAIGPGAPLRTVELPAASPLRVRPDSTALAMTELSAGARVSVLGSFDDWQLVAVDDPVGSTGSGSGIGPGAPPLRARGWIRSD